MTDSERIRKLTGMSRAAFSRKYNIPIRTLEDWDSGKNKPPQYVVELLERDVMRNLDLNLQALTPMIEGEEATILLNGVEYKASKVDLSSYEDIYYMSYLTYNYYLSKTGNKPNKWTSKEASYGPCYKDGQNGYCYVIDKAEMLKYDKMLLKNLFIHRRNFPNGKKVQNHGR